MELLSPAAFPELRRLCCHDGRKATRMSDTEHRKLREWVTELSPNAIWFLLTLIGSVIAVEIVGWIPDPIAKAIVVGIGLCLNAFLIAWLSWLRTQDSKANLRELTILLERIEKMQKAVLNARRKRQQQEEPRQPISSLESRHPETADLPSRTEFHDRPTSPRWGICRTACSIGRWRAGVSVGYWRT